MLKLKATARSRGKLLVCPENSRSTLLNNSILWREHWFWMVSTCCIQSQCDKTTWNSMFASRMEQRPTGVLGSLAVSAQPRRNILGRKTAELHCLPRNELQKRLAWLKEHRRASHSGLTTRGVHSIYMPYRHIISHTLLVHFGKRSWPNGVPQGCNHNNSSYGFYCSQISDIMWPDSRWELHTDSYLTWFNHYWFGSEWLTPWWNFSINTFSIF